MPPYNAVASITVVVVAVDNTETPVVVGSGAVWVDIVEEVEGIVVVAVVITMMMAVVMGIDPFVDVTPPFLRGLLIYHGQLYHSFRFHHHYHQLRLKMSVHQHAFFCGAQPLQHHHRYGVASHAVWGWYGIGHYQSYYDVVKGCYQSSWHHHHAVYAASDVASDVVRAVVVAPSLFASLRWNEFWLLNLYSFEKVQLVLLTLC